MAEVFISYIHEEEEVAKAVQEFIKTKFENKQNVFLSSDKWQVFAGEIWLDRIRQELDSAKVVILMLSQRSVERPWVNFEAGAAWLVGELRGWSGMASEEGRNSCLLWRPIKGTITQTLFRHTGAKS